MEGERLMDRFDVVTKTMSPKRIDAFLKFIELRMCGYKTPCWV
jgi:hypothetical protein